MRMPQAWGRLSLVTAMVAVALGCATTPPPGTTPRPNGAVKPNAVKPGAITVEEGGAVVAKNVAITLEADTAASGGARSLQQAAAAAAGLKFTYLAQVPPVKLGEVVTQANDLVACNCGDAAFIAYNLAGEDFGGAVQILDTTSKDRPRVLKTIAFPGMDINALFQDENKLYFGGAANPDFFPYRSFVGVIDLNDPTADKIIGSIKGLPSFGVTGIARGGEWLWVGVGARDGGVVKMDQNLQQVEFLQRDDVRAVAPVTGGAVALSGTVDSLQEQGKIYGLGGPSINIAMPDFGSRYAKATLETTAGGLGIATLSAAGLQVRQLSTGALRYSLANPSDSDKETANGASLDANHLFVAQGEYGFRVVRVKDANATGAAFGEQVGVHRLSGALYEGQQLSANLVRAKAGFVMVAAGVGGVHLYRAE